jgi:hypothetical protein
MSFNQHILEKGTFVSGIVPVALNTNPGSVSDYISMKGYARCTIIFFKNAGTAGDDPTITVSQAKTVAGGSAKALGFTRVDKKQVATNQLSTGTFTTSTSSSAASNDTFNTTNGTWTNSDLAEQTALVIIDISVDQMDIDGGFDCLTATVGDVGTNAQIGCLLYFLHEPRYSQATAPSAIAD